MNVMLQNINSGMRCYYSSKASDFIIAGT